MIPSLRNELKFLCTALLLLGAISLASSLLQTKVQPEVPHTVVILSPHFDDAALSMGGLIARNRSRATVLTFFSEKPMVSTSTHWDAISGFPNSDMAITLRTKENEQAFEALGAHIINMNFLDAQYRTATSSKETGELRDQIASRLEQYLDTTSGELDVYGPAYFGPDITHPDHALLHEALVAAFRHYALNPRIHFYFYEDFPYVAHFLRDHRTTLASFIAEHDHLTVIPRAHFLTADEINAKNASIGFYVSQLEAFHYLHYDVAREDRRFTESRCSDLPTGFQGCEVVYEVQDSQ